MNVKEKKNPPNFPGSRFGELIIIIDSVKAPMLKLSACGGGGGGGGLQLQRIRKGRFLPNATKTQLSSTMGPVTRLRLRAAAGGTTLLQEPTYKPTSVQRATDTPPTRHRHATELASLRGTMFSSAEDDEEQLRSCIIQQNIQESCQDSFLRSAARYQQGCVVMATGRRETLMGLKRFVFSPLA